MVQGHFFNSKRIKYNIGIGYIEAYINLSFKGGIATQSITKLLHVTAAKECPVLLTAMKLSPVRYVRASSGTSSYSSRNIWICLILILRSDSLNS